MKTLPERTELAVKIEAANDIETIKNILKEYTQEQVAEYINYLKCVRATNREDRLKLQILDQMDFTIWACDEDFIIRLWEGSCESIYGKSKKQAIDKNYLEQFVQPLEQHQSKVDALHIIRTGEKQPFRYCEDVDSRGFPIQIITQCCRIYDDPGVGEHESIPLQAEMAINMNYQKLVQESMDFIAVQKKEQEEMEKARSECIAALDTCRERVMKAADNRVKDFYNIASISANRAHETHTKALNAVKKIIDIRKNFGDYYKEQLDRLKKVECECDIHGKEDLDATKYTLENHSFNCVFRHNRSSLTKWRKDLELDEVNYQSDLSEVFLEENESAEN